MEKLSDGSSNKIEVGRSISNLVFSETTQVDGSTTAAFIGKAGRKLRQRKCHHRNLYSWVGNIELHRGIDPPYLKVVATLAITLKEVKICFNSNWGSTTASDFIFFCRTSDSHRCFLRNRALKNRELIKMMGIVFHHFNLASNHNKRQKLPWWTFFYRLR